jgi:hypothetical protein
MELKLHKLQGFHAALRELGVHQVEHLGKVTEDELRGIGMKRFDMEHFFEVFRAACVAPPAAVVPRTTLAVRPHFGDSTSLPQPAGWWPSVESVEHRSVAGLGARPRHCMLSYQWDDQQTVVKVRQALNGRGIVTWMDIDGGMNSDIFDSMAEGVSGSNIVAAFMTQKYQDSQNCKLEAKFAATQKIPIIPVMLQADWQATGWLGILTAGALWVPLHNQSAFEGGVDNLFDQIQKVAISRLEAKPHAHANTHTPTEGSNATLSALRSELNQLRLTMAQQQSETDVDVQTSAFAPVPAEVPQLPSTFRFTMDMQELKTLLLQGGSETSRTVTLSSQQTTEASGRVSAYGMGGIGKTMLTAGLCRDNDVRTHFDAILWVTLGQLPNILRLQQLLYLQVAGTEPPANSTTEALKESLRQKMAKKKVLLVLDDVWESAHEAALNTVDATSSKTLVTTRIKNLVRIYRAVSNCCYLPLEWNSLTRCRVRRRT